MAVTASMVKRIKRDDRSRNDGLQKRHFLQQMVILTKLLNSFVRRDLLLLRRKQEELPLKDL